MEAPQTSESWVKMPHKAAEWFKKVEAGEVENPYKYNDTPGHFKPYRPEPKK